MTIIALVYVIVAPQKSAWNIGQSVFTKNALYLPKPSNIPKKIQRGQAISHYETLRSLHYGRDDRTLFPLSVSVADNIGRSSSLRFSANCCATRQNNSSLYPSASLTPSSSEEGLRWLTSSEEGLRWLMQLLRKGLGLTQMRELSRSDWGRDNIQQEALLHEDV